MAVDEVDEDVDVGGTVDEDVEVDVEGTVDDAVEDGGGNVSAPVQAVSVWTSISVMKKRINRLVLVDMIRISKERQLRHAQECPGNPVACGPRHPKC